jgi:hypothetical protein
LAEKKSAWMPISTCVLAEEKLEPFSARRASRNGGVGAILLVKRDAVQVFHPSALPNIHDQVDPPIGSRS